MITLPNIAFSLIAIALLYGFYYSVLKNWRKEGIYVELSAWMIVFFTFGIVFVMCKY